MEEDGGLSKPAAVLACASLASFYVAILYAPTLILRLPPPSSSFLPHSLSHPPLHLRRRLLPRLRLRLPVSFGETSQLLVASGVVYPLALTALMYAGSLIFMLLLFVHSVREDVKCRGGDSFDYIKSMSHEVFGGLRSMACSVMHRRNYVVAPVTEELVFRACMVSLLLCAGFQKNTVIFMCPLFFSLAHLNHLMDVYNKQQNNWTRACMIIGLQLGYTVVFGSYASFLFIRTGHFLAPVVAHMFCNIMGLPLLISPGKGVVNLAFIAGLLGFMWLLFPITNSVLYNDRTDSCRCRCW